MIHARKDYDRIQDPANKIHEDEPVMLFRAKDVLAPAILAKYADLLRFHNADPVMIQTVLAHEQKMRQWQRMNGCKLPDIPADAAREE
jgi:hypothetical protein